MYEYRAKLDRVVDGDTVDLFVDMGFRCSINERFRLLDYNAPEMNTLQGPEAKAHLHSLIDGKQLVLYSTKRDGFRRWLGTLYIEGESVSINKQMIDYLIALKPATI